MRRWDETAIKVKEAKDAVRKLRLTVDFVFNRTEDVG